jgi:hypothetical protein
MKLQIDRTHPRAGIADEAASMCCHVEFGTYAVTTFD